MSEADNAYNAALEEDFQGNGVNALVVGDPHEMGAEDYEGLAGQYDSDDVDVVVVTGDLATNVALQGGDFDPEEFDESYTNSIKGCDLLGYALDVDVYSVRGNHWIGTDLHGIEEDEEMFDEHLDEKGFEGSAEEYFSQKADNVEFIDGETREVESRDYGLFGGFLNNYVSEIVGNVWNDLFGPEKDELTVLGGGPSSNGDTSPDETEELPELEALYEQSELDDEAVKKAKEYAEEELDMDEFSNEALREITDEQYQALAEKAQSEEELALIGNLYSEMSTQNRATERYAERKDMYGEMFENASENVLVLDHFMPDTRNESDIDKKDGKPLGKSSLRDVIEEYSGGEHEYNVTVAGGHSGGARYEEDVIGADLLRAGQYDVMEARFEDGEVIEAEGHSPEEWGGETKRRDVAGEQQDGIQRIKEMIDQGRDPQDIKEDIEQGDIPAQQKKELKRVVDEAAEEAGRSGGPSVEAGGEGRTTAGA